jgi:hypothetical protein
MRSISLLVGAGVLASCTTAPPPNSMRSAHGQQQFEQLLAGKVAQAPLNCLPPLQGNDMRVIDQETLIFRSPGGSRVYLAHMPGGGCTNLTDGGPYTLVTKLRGSSTLCHGDIAQVVDTMSHTMVGSCVFGDFVPYVTPGR